MIDDFAQCHIINLFIHYYAAAVAGNPSNTLEVAIISIFVGGFIFLIGLVLGAFCSSCYHHIKISYGYSMVYESSCDALVSIGSINYEKLHVIIMYATIL